MADPLRAFHDLSWLLLLRLLSAPDDSNAPYRWCDWASPDGSTRLALQQRGEGALLDFVNDELFPQLLRRGQLPSATPQQRLIGMVLKRTEAGDQRTPEELLDLIDDQEHAFVVALARLRTPKMR
jgi:hypothetical protein